MLTEFPSRFQRLFAGSMWSGSAKEDIRVPIKAKTNVPCRSITTQWRQDKSHPLHRQQMSRLKSFKHEINVVEHHIREFTKRMDVDLPFYYWTLNERLRPNTREDSSIFVTGRAHLPARHKKSIRQSFHKPESILPDPI
ncbi:uncharacterized protein [Montipora capricornis]|uniref:uncharacterized protein n=1 Tax=Montipora capricornis TaxID=246305 RepID=UPI0035F1B8E9